MAHTKGPWTVFSDVDPDAFPGIDAGNFSIVYWGNEDDDGGIHGNNPDEIAANARLIAAAPDLLEACRFALGVLQSGVTPGPGCDDEKELDMAADYLLAAIARAEGPASVGTCARCGMTRDGERPDGCRDPNCPGETP